MASYADKTYYRSTYIGRPITVDATLDKWLARATDDIDMYMFGSVDIADLTATALEMLKKACCAQAEDYVINGDGSDAFVSVSIGQFSMSKKDASASRDIGGLCTNALRYLTAAGLAFRGVKVCSPSRTSY